MDEAPLMAPIAAPTAGRKGKTMKTLKEKMLLGAVAVALMLAVSAQATELEWGIKTEAIAVDTGEIVKDPSLTVKDQRVGVFPLRTDNPAGLAHLATCDLENLAEPKLPDALPDAEPNNGIELTNPISRDLAYSTGHDDKDSHRIQCSSNRHFCTGSDNYCETSMAPGKSVARLENEQLVVGRTGGTEPTLLG